MLHCVNFSLGCVFLTVFGLAVAHDFQEMALYEGDGCATNSYDGKCLVQKQCPNLEATMTRKGLYPRDVGHCGYTVYEEIICCPEDFLDRPISKKFFRSTTTTTHITIIITNTKVVQTEKIGDELNFSDYQGDINAH